MPLDLTAIEKAFRLNIRTLLQMPENSVRRANQFDPPPAGDQETQFATVFIQQLGSTGWDEVTHQDVSGDGGYGEGGYGDGGYGTGESEDVTEFITGQRHFIASVQFFRLDALSKANSLTALLQSSTSVQTLLAAGIGLGKIGTVRNLTTDVDSFFENRAQLDVEFYVISQEQVDLPTYAEFEVAFANDFPPDTEGGLGYYPLGEEPLGE
jgi:hypothetical protein